MYGVWSILTHHPVGLDRADKIRSGQMGQMGQMNPMGQVGQMGQMGQTDSSTWRATCTSPAIDQ